MLYPYVKTWMRVNPSVPEDVEAALDFVPEESQEVIARYISSYEEGTRLVVFLTEDNQAGVAEEGHFRVHYLGEADTSERAADRAENGELDLFELATEKGRTDLALWASRLNPGVDLVALQAKVVLGDFVIQRPGHAGFEVYRRAEDTNREHMHMRLAVLQAFTGSGQDAGPSYMNTVADWVIKGAVDE